MIIICNSAKLSQVDPELGTAQPQLVSSYIGFLIRNPYSCPTSPKLWSNLFGFGIIQVLVIQLVRAECVRCPWLLA
jgi:hypothetical protein